MTRKKRSVDRLKKNSRLSQACKNGNQVEREREREREREQMRAVQGDEKERMSQKNQFKKTEV